LTSEHLPNLSGLVTDAKSFAKVVLDNRNFYPHHDPKIKKAGRVVSGAKGHRLNEKMKLLFQIPNVCAVGNRNPA
jgi:hypothetical protein